jgi:hypothetical protein
MIDRISRLVCILFQLVFYIVCPVVASQGTNRNSDDARAELTPSRWRRPELGLDFDPKKVANANYCTAALILLNLDWSERGFIWFPLISII